MPKYIVKSPVKLPDGIRQEGETIELDEQTADELIALGALEVVKDADADPAERMEAIKAAIVSLDKETAANWLNDGRPDASALTADLGFKVSAAERDAAWKLVQSEPDH